MNAKFGIFCWIGVALASCGPSALNVESAQNTGDQVLKLVADVPMPGPAVRFDYQSLDAEHGRAQGMKQFLDDKTYRPGFGPYDRTGE